MQGSDLILIIDDDVEYTCLLQVALVEARVTNPVRTIHDARNAVEYLAEIARDPEASSRIPTLVLLDLIMPKMTGLEVLRQIRSLVPLARMPVAVFTGVEVARERSQALALGASSLHIKPFAYRDLVLTAKRLRELYLGVRELEQAA